MANTNHASPRVALDLRRTLLVVNLLAKPTEVVIPGKWRDVLGDREVSGGAMLSSGGVLILTDASRP